MAMVEMPPELSLTFIAPVKEEVNSPYHSSRRMRFALGKPADCIEEYTQEKPGARCNPLGYFCLGKCGELAIKWLYRRFFL